MKTEELYSTMWTSVRNRFTEKAQAIEEVDLQKKLGETSIADLLYHTGQVEYLFADWYFGQAAEELPKPSLTNKAELLSFLEASNAFLLKAMAALPEEKWTEVVSSKMGDSTPAEVVGRLIYHAGIHSGQITDIQKYGA